MSLIDILILVLVLSWIGGFSFHVGGDVVHLLLVIALVALIVRLVRG